MDAEKMAREWLRMAEMTVFSFAEDEIASLAALLTTAHNTGLERAAEIAAEYSLPEFDDAWIPHAIAQAIRREIK